MSDSKEIQQAFGGNLPAFNPVALTKSAQSLPKSSDKPYLIFKDGEWTHGVDQTEVQPGSLWAVNVRSFRFGFMEWYDNKPGAEMSVPMGEVPDPSEVPLKFPEHADDSKHRISPLIMVDLVCLNGEDKGIEVHYSTSTRGGVDALNGLCDKVGNAARGDNPEAFVPIIELGESNYMHKKYKRKTYVPVIDVKQWDDENLSTFHAPKKPGKTSKAKKATKPAPEEVVEETTAPETEAPPPARKRRARVQ